MRFSIHQIAVTFLVSLLFFVFSCKNTQTVETQYDGGQLYERYEIRSKDSVKVGKFHRFHPDGWVQEEMYFENGVQQGEHIFYSADGVVEQKRQIKDDKNHGKNTTYFPSGQVRLELPYTDGVLVGEGRAFYENGQLKEIVHFKDNDENGPFIEYYENGKLKAEGQYLQGANEQDTLKLYDTLGILDRIMYCQSGLCRTIWQRQQ